MGFDLTTLQDAVARHGKVARVVIAEVNGSSPREVGASMLVWDGGQSGTIGGGALEYDAAAKAFDCKGLTTHALGPELGQCCGGAVTLLTEIYDQAAIAELEGQTVIARGPGAASLAVLRLLDQARGQGLVPDPQLLDGWMIEPVTSPQNPVWIWGAGHVGRALVSVFEPLPDHPVTWVDTAPNRFPNSVADDINILPAEDPTRVVPYAPQNASHIIVTYSHALDLALCDALLRQNFTFAGLIGSKTKWARFRKRLQTLGHSDAAISRITCPIGQKSLGKHPHAIAVGVCAQLLNINNKDRDTDWQTHSLASKA